MCISNLSTSNGDTIQVVNESSNDPVNVLVLVIERVNKWQEKVLKQIIEVQIVLVF